MAYASTAQLKTYLGISGSGDDTLLGDLLTRAQKAIETETDRVFESSSTGTRNFDTYRDVSGDVLWLDEDLAAITSITNGDGTSLASTDYVTEPRNETPYYAIRLLASSGYVWELDSNGDPEDAIAVVGNWAYSTSAPADITHATIRLAAYYYRQKDAQVFDTIAQPDLGIITVPAGIPADVKKILARYKRPQSVRPI